MDVETSAAIERLSERIDELDVSIRGEMATLRGEMATLGTELRTAFREGLAENGRHTEILFESLRDDIRILAEGFATVSVKLDSLQR